MIHGVCKCKVIYCHNYGKGLLQVKKKTISSMSSEVWQSVVSLFLLYSGVVSNSHSSSYFALEPCYTHSESQILHLSILGVQDMRNGGKEKNKKKKGKACKEEKDRVELCTMHKVKICLHAVCDPDIAHKDGEHVFIVENYSCFST